jgi:hypothetical protein
MRQCEQCEFVLKDGVLTCRFCLNTEADLKEAEARRIERLERMNLKPTRKPPYSWCSQPEVCSLKGYCVKEISCGD